MSNSKRVPTPVTDGTADSAAAVAIASPVESPSSETVTEASPAPAAAELPAEPAPDDISPVPDDGERVECRVLLAFAGNKTNDVVALDPAELDRLQRSNHVCAHPASVAFAKGLRA